MAAIRSRMVGVLAGMMVITGASMRPCIGQSWAPQGYARKILSNRPLPPTDVTLFSSVVYHSHLSGDLPAPGPELTEEQAALLLRYYTQGESPNNPSYLYFVLKDFSAESTRTKIASPSLRAALFALGGTLASPAIDFILSAKTPEGLPKVKEIRFDDGMAGSYAAGRLEIDEKTQQMTLRFNSDYRAENPFLFTSVLAGFVLHQDSLTGDYETVVTNALQDLIYLQQLSRHPELAQSRTRLSRLLNAGAAERLNSGVGWHLGLYATNGNAPLLFGSFTGPRSYVDFRYVRVLDPTPGNPMLVEYLKRIYEGGVPPPTNDFSRALLDWIDQNQGAMTDEQLVAAAMALKLDVSFVRP